MTWTNAFDLGTCTVAVIDRTGGGARSMFSQVMAKGDSQTFTDATLGMDFTVAIDSAGSVSLSSASALGSSGTTLSLRVIPDFDVGTDDRRISGIALDPTMTAAYAISGDTDGGVAFTAINPPAPDPFERAFDSGTLLLGCDAYWGAI